MKPYLTLLTLFFTTLAFAADKPNIILIYTDDQGYGDCSLLNKNSKFQTPNIDRIGTEGIVYTDGHSADTVCSPSRYSLLTGRYSWRTYLKKAVVKSAGKPMIANDRTTLASLLKRNGYNTAMSGKWHMGMTFADNGKIIVDGPINKGFDYYFGIPASMNYGYNAWYEMNTAAVPPSLFTQKKKNTIAIDDYRIIPPYDKKGKSRWSIKVAPDFEDIKVLQKFTEKAIAWIDKIHSDEKPFFLYLPLTSPHKPVIPQKRFRGKSRAGAYGDFMIETDHWVGEIMKTLKKHKIDKNTMIIFSSDNGPENTYPKRIELYQHLSAHKFRGGKREIYEGGHRVPFMISWPNGILSGQVCNQMVNQLDIYATIAEVVGDKVKDNEAEDSFSFAGTFTGKNFSRQAMIHHSISGGFAIRKGKWKLVLGTGPRANHISGKRELYNLEKDPQEKHNVIEQHAELSQEMEKDITSIILRGRSGKGPKAENDTPVKLPWKTN